MSHRVAPAAEVDLDDIWLYVAKESSSLEIADRLIGSITDRFHFLTGFPFGGRDRSDDFGKGVRSFPAGDYVILYCIDDEDVLILRVVHGKRDLDSLF